MPDGDPIITHSSRLLPVRYGGAPAMLKIATEQEEQRGGALMVWWDGNGAARVLAHDGNAMLLERATGTKSLAEMVECGDDDEASRILCVVAAKLHAPRSSPPPELVPLPKWFEALALAAASQGGILARASRAAQALLSAPQDAAVLHGDIHHGNVLDFAARGWLAIDPKGLSGERGFDFANIFCNPDFALATATGRLARQASIVAKAAGMDRKRLLQWVLAYAGLSAAWFIDDGGDPGLPLAVAEAAAAELSN
jgi:streptomycin 6-kinase